MKKTALATAIALTIIGGPIMAETSTVQSQFIVDKTELASGSTTVNFALLGLQKDAEVDLYGEEKGSIIMAVVKSEIGDVSCGAKDATTGVVSAPDTHPGSVPIDTQPSEGSFTGDVNYIRLIQGNGATCITYDPDVIGDQVRTDVVEMFLQERIPTANGGVTFERIGQVVKKSITVNPPDVNPKALRIGAFKPAPNDPRGVADCFTATDIEGNFGSVNHCESDIFKSTGGNHPLMGSILLDDGIMGETMAGTEGGQILVVAKNANAVGNVTVTLRSKFSSEEYSFTGRMTKGEAIITMNADVEKTGSTSRTYGDYYVEATMDGFDGNSVQLVYEDVLRVWSTGDVRGLKMWTDKTVVAKPDFDDATVKAGSMPQLTQGAEVGVHLLDQYGNPTSNCPQTSKSQCLESEVRVKVSDDTGLAVSNTAIDLIVPINNWGYGVPNSKDAIIGNAANEVIGLGTGSLVARAVDAVGNALSSISDSAPVPITVVGDSLKVTDVFSQSTNPNLNKDQLAGVEFNFATVTIMSDKGQVRTFQEGGAIKTVDPGAVTITNMSTGESLTINRKSGEDNSDDEDVVKALFKQHSYGGLRYLIGSANNAYGQVWVDAKAVIPAAASVVTLSDAHGNGITSIAPTGPKDTQYTTIVPEITLKMADSFGNSVTAGTPETDKTGEFFVNTPNGKVEYRTTESSKGIPGRNLGTDLKAPVAGPGSYRYTHVAIIYQGAGNDLFAGEDAIELQFTKPGLGINTLTIGSNVPALQELGSIVSHLETKEIPVNSVVALTLETLDTDGAIYDPSDNIVVTVQFGGVEGDDLIPVVIDNDTGDRLGSGQSVEFTGNRKVFLVKAGPRVGQFSLTFVDANQTVAAETRTITVTRAEVPPDDTLGQCEANGKVWINDGCVQVPVLSDPAAGGKNGVLNPVDGVVSMTSDAQFTGGISTDSGITFGQARTINVTDNTEVTWVANIAFDPKDEDKLVDIIVVASYSAGSMTNLGGATYYLTGGETPNIVPVVMLDPGALGTVEPFIAGHEVQANGNKSFIIYQGEMGVTNGFAPGKIDAYVGYRKQSENGGQINFNLQPLRLILQ